MPIPESLVASDVATLSDISRGPIPVVHDPHISGELSFITLANVVDVGLGGVGLETRDSLRVGHPYSIHLQDDQLTLSGLTVWHRLTGSAEDEAGRIYPIYRSGIQFDPDCLKRERERFRQFLIDNVCQETPSPRPTPRFHLKSDTPRVLHSRYTFDVTRLSAQGMVVELAQVPEPDTRLALALRLDGGPLLEARARLSDVMQTIEADGLRTQVALRFESMSPEARDRLIDWLRERHATQPSQ